MASFRQILIPIVFTFLVCVPRVFAQDAESGGDQNALDREADSDQEQAESLPGGPVQGENGPGEPSGVGESGAQEVDGESQTADEEVDPEGALAEEYDDGETLWREEPLAKAMGVGMGLEALFPLYTGASININLKDSFEIFGAYGLMPEMFSSAVGSLVAQLGENESYGSAVSAALATNSQIKFGLRYFRRSAISGWHFAMAMGQMSSQGEVDVATTLSAATGVNFADLLALLDAENRSTANLKSSIIYGEVTVGYSWALQERMGLGFDFGIANILTANFDLQTGIAAFENSDTGGAVLDSAESQMAKILKENGLAPILGLHFRYYF